MATQLQIRRGTAAQVAAFTGAEGEIVYNSTNDSLHTNDGATAGGFELARADLNNVSDANLNAALTGNTVSALTITTLTATGGTINGTVIGGTTAAAGSFTTLTATGSTTINGGAGNAFLVTTTTGAQGSGVSSSVLGQAWLYGVNWGATDGRFAVYDNTAGAERFSIAKTTGAATFSGDVGIGGAPLANNQLLLTDAGTYSQFHMQNLTSGSGASDGFRILMDGVNTTITNHETGYMAFETQNTERMRIDSVGNASFNTTDTAPAANNVFGTAILQYGGASMSRTNSTTLDLNRSSSDGAIISLRRDGTTVGSIGTGGGALVLGNGNAGLYFNTSLSTVMPWSITNNTNRDAAIDIGQSANRFKNVIISRQFSTTGTISGGYAFYAANNAGSLGMYLNNSNSQWSATYNGGASTANCTMTVGKDSGTSRSINAGGTINASGADYAEYEQNNGLTISKGSVVGFKADGTLTLTFSEAVRFAIKSTDPAYVGGDTWANDDAVGTKPMKPNDDAEQSTIDEYETDLATFEEALEAARQLVDRIAYSGKVPVNIQGATAGDYIIAVAAGDGSITGQAVSDPDFSQYKLSVGRVNRILDDGRAEVAVIIH